MIRTRAVIERLSYDSLVKEGIIPDVYSMIVQSPTGMAAKRYPPFVYSGKDFSFFGMFWDYVVRAGLRMNIPGVELGIDAYTQIVQTLPDEEMLQLMMKISSYENSNNMNDIATSSLVITSAVYGTNPYSLTDIQGYVPTMVNVIKELIARWNTYQLTGPVKFNTEFVHGQFSGHPDIVTSNVVLDIKTTASFGKMAKEACLQVLAYYALMKPTTPALQMIGFVLPMQRDILLYNLGNWNPAQYLQLLSSEADKLAATENKQIIIGEDGTLDLTQINDPRLIQAIMAMVEDIIPQGIKTPDYKIGGHIAKGKDIAATLRDFTTKAPGLPCQMFLRNTRSGKIDAKTPGRIAAAAEVIRETGLLYFTHSAYVINLCANQCDETGDYWQQRILNEDLDYTVAMGGKGVVVHTGARKHLPEDQALYIMEYMVRIALAHATETCPLLLETPCGEGTEVCTSIEDLGNFFLRFTEEERKRLGLCVDTCHIFSAKYNRPLAYLQHWEKYCSVPIKLVHFNDSEEEAGCCVDRHAAPGHGKIGMEKMMEVAQWCYERKIPMVRE